MVDGSGGRGRMVLAWLVTGSSGFAGSVRRYWMRIQGS